MIRNLKYWERIKITRSFLRMSKNLIFFCDQLFHVILFCYWNFLSDECEIVLLKMWLSCSCFRIYSLSVSPYPFQQNTNFMHMNFSSNGNSPRFNQEATNEQWWVIGSLVLPKKNSAGGRSNFSLIFKPARFNKFSSEPIKKKLSYFHSVTAFHTHACLYAINTWFNCSKIYKQTISSNIKF